MQHSCTLAWLLVLVFSVASPLSAETALSTERSSRRLSLDDPSTAVEPSVDAIAPIESDLSEPMSLYRGAHYRGAAHNDAVDPTCGCAEYFGGFGPLWANYCQERQACGMQRGCGTACGCETCYPACRRVGRHRSRILGCRGPGCVTSGKSKMAAQSWEGGSPQLAPLQSQPPDIGTPPEPPPTPPAATDAEEASRVTPTEQFDLGLPADRSASRPVARQ